MVRSKPVASVAERLFAFDQDVLAENLNVKFLIGIDEVGRGSLVGPILSAAVCFTRSLTDKEQAALRLLNDSKKVSAENRERLADMLAQCACVALGEASKQEVDTLNVYHASLLASYRAYCAVVAALDVNASAKDSPAELLVLMDGNAYLPQLPKANQRTVIKGDGQSAAIAAASVIAKHARDSLMKAMSRDFPAYGWEQNMGYGTPGHLTALETHGVTPHHRRHFKSVSASQLRLSLSISG